MDICVLNPFFEPHQGGTEKVLLQVYRRLAKRHNVTVICSAEQGSNRDSADEVDGIKVVRLRSEYTDLPASPMPFVRQIGLQDAIKKEKAEIYHINNRFLYFHDTVKAIKEVDGKLAITIHNSLPKNIDFITDTVGLIYDVAWARKLIHMSDVITGVSEDAVRVTVPKEDWRRAKVIYNGVDHKLFRKIQRSDKKLKRIDETIGLPGAKVITNGRLVPQKGQIYLMRAMADIFGKDGRDASLLAIGRGLLHDALVGAAGRLGVADRFRIASGIPEGDLPYYYNACDIFALPSLYEPAGVVALEAMACEVPSIVSNIGGLPELVGKYGLLSRPRDVDDIKAKILYDLDHIGDARALAKKARRHVVENFDWDRISRQYEEMFLKAVG